MNLKFNKKQTKWLIGVVASCIVIYIALNNIPAIGAAFSFVISLFMPLILGTAFAMILNIPMRYFENLLFKNAKNAILIRMKSVIAFIIALSVILGVILGIVWLIIPELTDAVNIIINGFNEMVNDVKDMDKESLSKNPFGSLILKIDFDSLVDSFQDWLKSSGTRIFSTAYVTVSSIFGVLYNILLGFVFSVYFLFGKIRLKNQCKRLVKAWLPEKAGGNIIEFSSLYSKNFGNFIAGQTIEALILGVLCAIGMLILQLPYVPMVSAMVGVLSIIPVIGGFAGVFVGSFVILTVSPIKALIFFIFLIILLQIEGNLIYPRVMGSRVNLSGLWILCAVVVGGGLAGPAGILLGVPFASTLYVMIKKATENREQRIKSEAYTADDSPIITDDD